MIGRNEGERLRQCIEALAGEVRLTVYVDSDSGDDSVALARSLGADVVELDMSAPFTAARARNTGLARLTELEPGIEFVHFFDGDCELIDGWLARALETIESGPEIAMACGLLRERYPEKTVYNRLCDLEWRFWPYGEVDACGGIALARVEALKEVGGFDPGLIAGEEPELCFRLREKGWKIFRVRADMAYHDAAMTRFAQWWRRAFRAGYAYAEGAWLHGSGTERYCVRNVRSNWFWGLLLPAAGIGGALVTGGWGLLLLGVYPVQVWRIQRTMRKHKGLSRGDARVYAAFCVLAKLPLAAGQVRFHVLRMAGKRATIIEYK